MPDVVILGTDTGVGKTTFAALWLAAFADDFEYWKPFETGDSDSEQIGRWLPAIVVHAPVRRFERAVAPLLAAREEHCVVPSVAAVAAAKPRPRHQSHLLIETFGSPLGPLNE